MSDQRRLVLAVAALLSAAAGSASAAVVTAKDGSVFQQASAQLNHGAVASDAQADSWSGARRDLHASVSTGTFSGENGAIVHSTINARWASADSGSIDVTNHGWQIFAGSDIHNTDIIVGLNNAASGVADWAYDFTADSDGTMVIGSHFFGSDADLTGMGNWNVAFSEDGGALHSFALNQGLRAGDNGGTEFFLPLAQGHSYQLALVSDEGVDFSGIFPNTANETANFTWKITGDAVPEPSTWALSILGFGLSGAALRRRRAVAASPSPAASDTSFYWSA